MNPVPVICGRLGPITEGFGVILKVTLGENSWEERTALRPGWGIGPNWGLGVNGLLSAEKAASRRLRVQSRAS